MPFTFVHLSDIHFGQEKRSGIVVTNDDAKERLIADAAKLVECHANGHACGIIVTGDIAYGGKRGEYVKAGEWLDRLAIAIGCKKTSVHVVPGNHDIDRDAISTGCQLMLDQIIEHGEVKLDAFLDNPLDREVLYGRFIHYRPFAEGYDCPLDPTGGYASDKTVDLAPGKRLRLIGLNSALICSSADQEGKLLLGERQHVLPRTDGEELVVLGHHPLHWLRDSESARRFVRSRARVFVSGHEHNPALTVEHIREGCDLLTIAAGATVPPRVDEKYTFTYNLLTFDWDEASDGLRVTIFPRTWSNEETDFVEDDARLGTHGPTTVLGCPNFRNSPKSDTAAAPSLDEALPCEDFLETRPTSAEVEMKDVSDQFRLLLLRFFRDLSPAQRIAVLVEMQALPPDWSESLTHAIERSVVDGFVANGRLEEFANAIRSVENS